MPEPVTPTTRIAVDPDGLPVALVDLVGDQIDGTLWGAVRAGGCFALVVTEYDHFTRAPGGPPTRDNLLALADALTDDPNDPHLIPNTRAWWREEAARLRGVAEHAELARAEAVDIAQGLRDALDLERRNSLALAAKVDARQPATPRRSWWRR